MLRAKWPPRLENEEADALTNMDFRHFDAAKRVHVELDSIGFRILPRLFEHGESYLAEVEAARAKAKDLKEKRKSEGLLAGSKRKKMGQTLRERDPWV